MASLLRFPNVLLVELNKRITRYTPLEHIKNLLKNIKTNALKSK